MDWIRRLREANTGTIINREKDALIRKYEPKFRSFFLKQGKTFLKNIAEYKEDFPESAHKSLFARRLIDAAGKKFNFTDFDTAWTATEAATNPKLQKLILEIEQEAMTKGSAAVDQLFIGPNAADFLGRTSFTLENPRAVAWFSQNGGSLDYIKDIQGTSKDQLQTLITHSLDEGWSYNQTSKAISQKFEGMSRTRSKLIATNEAAQAYEAGTRGFIDGLSDLGVEMVKRWNNSEDGNVSAGCQANTADGWIALDREHTSGHQNPPRFPGCRCYETYEEASYVAAGDETPTDPIEHTQAIVDDMRAELDTLNQRRSAIAQKLRDNPNISDNERGSIMSEIQQIKAKVKTIEAETRSKIHKDVLFSQSEGETTFTVTTQGKFIDTTGDAVDEAFEWYNQVVSSPKVKRDITIVPTKTASRSYATGAGDTIHIANGESAKNIIHELGHSLEELDSTVWKSARQFYVKRTAKEKTKKLASVTMQKSYGSELTKTDHFIDPYMGKWATDVAENQEYTELVSMGLEKLYANPVELFEKDSEYYSWIINIVRGVTA
jgi:hypothetical protein